MLLLRWVASFSTKQNKTIIPLLAEKSDGLAIWPVGNICWLFGPVVAEILKFSHVVFDDPVNVTVSLTKRLFASFGRFCKYSKDLKWKYRELSGACLESKWPLLRCRECPLPPSTPCFSLHHCTLHLLRHCTCFAFHCSSSALHQHC